MVARFRLNERCLDAASLCRTLSKNLGLGEIDNVDALEAALDARPSGFIVVEEAHLSFLRRVGGLEGVSTLLEILGRTHDRHFWVVTFHLPAWYYLSRLGGLLKVHIFQHRLELPPMPEGALRELLVRRTEEAGYTLDYLRLVRRGTLSGDALGELEHSTTAFYRVLREASYGNPSIAAELWRDCVHADPAKKMLYVRMAPALSEGRIEDLGEAELFTLAALRMQGGLTEKELVQVNNMRPGAVRASLQILRARDLIERNERGFRVRARQQATVTRTLQYRHFLDWRTTHGI